MVLGGSMHTSFEIKDDMEKRVKSLLSGNESISVFCYKALEERVNRMEARSERARIQQASKDKAMIEPIFRELLKDFGIMDKEK